MIIPRFQTKYLSKFSFNWNEKTLTDTILSKNLDYEIEMEFNFIITNVNIKEINIILENENEIVFEKKIEFCDKMSFTTLNGCKKIDSLEDEHLTLDKKISIINLNEENVFFYIHNNPYKLEKNLKEGNYIVKNVTNGKGGWKKGTDVVFFQTPIQFKEKINRNLKEGKTNLYIEMKSDENDCKIDTKKELIGMIKFNEKK